MTDVWRKMTEEALEQCGDALPPVRQDKMLALQVSAAKQTLEVTKGALTSGTVACRLWNELNALVKTVEVSKAAILVVLGLMLMAFR